jgi:hypothetical protein
MTMRIWFRLAVSLICVLIAMPAMAEDPTLEERVKRLERGYQDLEGKEKREREGVRPETVRPEIIRPAEPSGEPGIGSLPEVGRERRAPAQPALSFGSTGSGRLVYAKPFVAAPKAIVGGYMDIQFRSHRKNSIENGFGGISNNFDQQRFVPFIYADITEHVKFAAEIEIEHGIREEGGPDREIEFGLEFAHIDYLIKEPFNLRAGILLVPIGKFNLLHDSPLNDLTDRPLVSQFIIPSTVAETGAGFYGTLYPGRTGKVDYEFYVTTGPCGYSTSGAPTVNEHDGTRGARQRKCGTDDGFDINNGKAVTGRVAVSPFLGVEVAGSGYYGNSSPTSYNPLSIFAIDWTLQRGPFELIGEAAWAYTRNNARAIPGNTLGPTGTTLQPGSILSGLCTPNDCLNPAGLPPQRMNGFYIQGNYHFMPAFLTKLSPKRFGEGSTFTAVVRYDRVNTNLDFKSGAGDLEQISFGLNYRPIEDTVFKISYQYMPKAFNPNTGERIHDSAVVLSAATYF